MTAGVLGEPGFATRCSQRQQAKTNGVVAIKAVAHKLARAGDYILRDQVPFEVNKAFA